MRYRVNAGPAGSRNRPIARRAVLAALLLGLLARTAAQSGVFAQGERLFLENKPLEASALLERATRENPQDEKAWLYLGICYQQLGRHDESVAVFRKGLPSALTLSHVFYFNMGNSFLAQKRNAFAEEMYGQAIQSKPDWAPPFLNRANARMAQEKYADAVADYTVYLSLNPSTPQAESIRKVIDLIGKSQAAEAARKAAEEARKLAEEQARQALLAAVADSLRQSAEDTTSLSAGSGDVQGYTEEFTLED